MLPTLSRLSVSTAPEGRLRHRPSSRYLRISPLHREFRPPLTDSSRTVSKAVLWLSHRIPPQTCPTAYSPFKPSDSEQRSPPLSYRGCWHRVSRGLFVGYHPPFSPTKGVYNPKAFFLHAASLRQASAHCAIFPTAASRRSLDRISVPVWPSNLSARLPVLGLVSHYLTNYLIGRRPILRHLNSPLRPFTTSLPARGLMRY